MQDLFGPEIKTFPIVVLLVLVQIWMCSWVSKLESWWWILFWTYCVGGTITHALQMAIHELSHNLCFETPVYNQILAIFANLPSGIPSSSMFKRYHMEHHQYQGVDKIDTDIPIAIEVNTVRNNAFLKLLWVIIQPLLYGGRPFIINPKQLTKWEYINATAQIIANIATLLVFGWRGMFYFIGGNILGCGLHPSAGHFIAEHYEFVKGTETYSYYGPINYLNFNVGYHNEHHDFPKIAWSRLPRVREMAPEFYSNLPCHTSYLKVLWTYITDESIGPFSRIKHPTPKNMAKAT